MSSKNHWIAAAFVVGGALSATAGMIVRDRLDVPFVQRSSMQGPLMASRELTQDFTEIPERQYFEHMSALLKREYVDPITDDQVLISGAVRGMVGSLEDPRSLYMDADNFRAFQEARAGNHEGIGVELKLVLPAVKTVPQGSGTTESRAPAAIRIPKLVIFSVVPGSPAEKAGLQPGDVVDTVNGNWVLNSDELESFRDLQRRVLAKEATADDLNKAREALRVRMEHSIMPMRARERLLVGKDGAMNLAVRRGRDIVEVKLDKSVTRVEPVVVENGTFVVHFQPGVGEALNSRLPKSGTVKLDFRNNAFADESLLHEVLRALAPNGSYGNIVSERAKSTPLTVVNGRTEKLTYEITVDKTTSSAAEIVALALAEKGLAKLSGGSVAGDPTVSEVVRLPDGSGFTLARGTYKPEVTK